MNPCAETNNAIMYSVDCVAVEMAGFADLMMYLEIFKYKDFSRVVLDLLAVVTATFVRMSTTVSAWKMGWSWNGVHHSHKKQGST